jgi:hypothetical protein
MSDQQLELDAVPDEPHPASSKTCERCSKPFEPRIGSGGRPQRYCSPKCRAAAANNTNKSPTTAPTTTPQPETLARPIAERGPPDFDWCNDDSVVIHEQRETAVYFNNYGQVIIPNGLTGMKRRIRSSCSTSTIFRR